MLLDPGSGQVALVAPQVIRACADPFGVAAESMRYMVETRTPVCRSLDEVGSVVAAHRAQVAAEAERWGAVMVSSGVAPFGVPEPAPLTEDPRYAQLVTAFPEAMRTTGTCACHVHVSVPDQDAGVHVLAQLRRWLPVLVALTANSPVWQGRDTGWASWRYVYATRWPTTVPAPPVRSAAEYLAGVRAAVAEGRAWDERSVYYLARLSPRYPTVEVRLADACLTVAQTVAYAGLVRALVGCALTVTGGPGAAEPIPQEGLVRACRVAAQVGLAGALSDPTTGRDVPAWSLVDELVAHVLPCLERYGDDERVTAVIDSQRTFGGGAQRQRRLFREAPSPERFVAALARATSAPQVDLRDTSDRRPPQPATPGPPRQRPL